VDELLIYDGDCQFCRLSLDFGIRKLSVFPEFVAYQRITPADFGLSSKDVASKIWLVSASGAQNISLGGHLAVAQILRAQPQFYWRALALVMRTPPTSVVANWVYEWVAKNRHRLPGGSKACQIKDTYDGQRQNNNG
jgi:predicted DCC family thiol-disulfide oxidoreductase YuxK